MCLRDGQLNVQRCGYIHEPVRLHDQMGFTALDARFGRCCPAFFPYPFIDGLSAVTGEISEFFWRHPFLEHNDSLNSRGVN